MNMTSKETRKPRIRREKLGQIVQVKCDNGFVLDFDKCVAKLRKTRSDIVRELMQNWLQEQERKSA